ncbi:hypothetical protein C4573_04885 [Candidatus Woesearchaeota archaeon]|nr:MAG: hypothetical protein C4573_04885 [Candidatus Woesearchaeota archaeon]
MRKILFAVLLLAFFVVSCGQKQVTSAFDPYAGGNTGLALSFQEGNPPEEIFDAGQYPFGIGVIIENKGEYDFVASRDYGKVSLIGLNSAYFGNPETSKAIDVDVKGKRKNFEGTIIDGDITSINFENFNYQQDIFGNDFFTLRAEACYDYQTRVSTKICIKENVIETSKDADKICKLNEVKSPKNSGAPVQITSLSQNPAGQNKASLLLVISHVGTGQIYKKGSQRFCDDSVTNVDKNIVYVTVSLPEDTDATVNCPALSEGGVAGYVNLYNGAPRTVTCTVTMGNEGKIYEPVFLVTLDYLYGEYIEKDIIIKDVSAG